MRFKSLTIEEPVHKDGDTTKVEEELDFDISQRPLDPKKKRKTKKSVYYADQNPIELKLKLNQPNDEGLEKIKNRQSALVPQVDLTLFDELEENNENFNFKGYLRRRYAVSKKKNYFAPEKTLAERTMENFSEIIENEIFFNTKNLIIFMLYHFFFHFLTGPATALLTFRLTGFSVYRNLFFWGSELISLLNYLQYILFVITFTVYFGCYEETSNISLFIILMILPPMFLRICIISIKYATLSQDKIAIILTRTVDKEDLLNELTFLGWIWQTDDSIEKELSATMERTELDLAMFKFSFLSDIDTKIRKELEHSIQNESKKSVSTERPSPSKKKNSKIDFLESKIMSYEHLLQNYAESDLSGYYLIKYLLKNIRDNNQKALKISLYVVVFIGMLRGIFPILIEVSMKNVSFNSLEVSLLVLAATLSSFYFTTNYIFLISGVFEMDRSYHLLSQLSNLLSPKPTEQYHTRKTLPTINFFCPISLKCWDSLHKIFRNYGAKFRLRVNYYLSIFLLYITIILVIIVLSVFNVVELKDPLIMIVFGFDISVILVALMVIFFKALVINDFYHIHIFLIKKNKNVLSDLLNLYGVYFEKDDFVPDNEIYKEGVFRIKSNVTLLLNYENRFKKGRRNTNFHITNSQKEEIIKKSLSNLIEICDNIIQDLQFCVKYMPFKVLGISVNKQFIQSVLACIGSVLIIVIQKVVKDKDLF